METIDLSERYRLDLASKSQTWLLVTIELDKKTILDTLACELVSLNGVLYEVPETQLLAIMRRKSYGSNEIHLKLVDND